MHSMVDGVGVMASDFQCAAVFARDQGCMEQGQWLRSLPVYWLDAALFA
jgi:hypothetical protein